MSHDRLIVGLGAARYRVERPWGDIPGGALVSDVACDARGHVFVLLRHDPYLGPDAQAVIELAPDGRRLAAWGGAEIADGHMLACAPDGRLFVVDRDAHQIVVFDRSTTRPGSPSRRGATFTWPTDTARRGCIASPPIFLPSAAGASRARGWGSFRLRTASGRPRTAGCW